MMRRNLSRATKFVVAVSALMGEWVPPDTIIEQ